MIEVVQRFATSEERIAILDGLLRYRAELRRVGIASGVQWLDGSFVEMVEDIRGRAPKDIDVVTFADRPVQDATEFVEIMLQNPKLFDPHDAKAAYRVDAYFMDTLKPSLLLVDDVTYFFGLFSHQRATSLWKGMLTVPLDESDDADARKLLDNGAEDAQEA